MNPTRIDPVLVTVRVKIREAERKNIKWGPRGWTRPLVKLYSCSGKDVCSLLDAK